MSSKPRQRPKNGEYVGEAIERPMLTGTKESHDNVLQKKGRWTKIDGRDTINAVAFLDGGEHVAGGGKEGKIRRWRIEDGQEVGTPMDAGSPVCDIAVSPDGKWVVGGMESGSVAVWSAESHSKVTRFKAHSDRVRAVDVSPDGTEIATGAHDGTAHVWSLSTGRRLADLSGYCNALVALKFSPDGRLIASATLVASVRIRDRQNGRLLVEFPIPVNPALNQSLAWASDSKRLFVLSRDGNIHCLDVSAGTSRWSIDGSTESQCIVLASNDKFIAASTLSSVSFWDTTTQLQTEFVVHHAAVISFMAISSNYDLVTAGLNLITVHNLRDVLPSSYWYDVSASASGVYCVKWFSDYFFDVYRRAQVRSFVP